MKSVLIVAIVAVAMIGVMVPDALGKTYVGEVDPYSSREPYGFSMDYPNDWIIQDPINNERLDLRIWEKNFLTIMRIIYIADHTMPPLSDNEHIDLMNKLAKDNCNGDIFFQGRSCYDFAHLSEEGNSIVYEIDGHKAKTTFYTLTIDYGDPNYPKLHPIIRTVTNIFVGNDLWVIFSDSEDYVFEEHYDLIMDTITSLRFEQTTPEQTTPEQTTPNETFEVTTIIGLLITLLIVASIVIPIYKKIRSSKDKAKSSKQCENCRGNWISTGTICEYCERMFNLPDNERISSSTNPYDILGISRNSSQNEIKTAYRKLIKKYDPSFGSVNRTKEEQEIFEKIGVKLHLAWEQLKRK